VLKSREERGKKFEDIERRAEIATQKFEEKERRRAEERELKLVGRDDGSEGSDDSDDFIVSDESEEGRGEMGDEPEAAEMRNEKMTEMSKNIFETGMCCARLSFCRMLVRPMSLVLRMSHCDSDTPLFACQCSKGKERGVVCDVMAKCPPPPPCAAFPNPTHPPDLHAPPPPFLCDACQPPHDVRFPPDTSPKWPPAVATKFARLSSTIVSPASCAGPLGAFCSPRCCYPQRCLPSCCLHPE
jgi:hypothetical protein